MIDYKTMYHTLFNAMSDSIECLKQAQLQAEELYIRSEEPVVLEIVQDSEQEDPDSAILHSP